MDLLADLDKLAAKKASGFRPTARARPGSNRPAAGTRDTSAVAAVRDNYAAWEGAALAPAQQHDAAAADVRPTRDPVGLDVSGLAAAPTHGRPAPAAHSRSAAVPHATVDPESVAAPADKQSTQRQQHGSEHKTAAARGPREAVAPQSTATPVAIAVPATAATQPRAIQSQPQPPPALQLVQKGSGSVLAAVAEHFGAPAVLVRRRQRKPARGPAADSGTEPEPGQKRRGRPPGSGRKKQKLLGAAEQTAVATTAATATHSRHQAAAASTSRRPRRAAAAGAALGTAAAVHEHQDIEADAGGDSSSDWDAGDDQPAPAGGSADQSSASDGEDERSGRRRSGRGRGRHTARGGKRGSSSLAGLGPSSQPGRPSRKAAVAAVAASAALAAAQAAERAGDAEAEYGQEEEVDEDAATIAKKQQWALCNRRGKICPEISIQEPIDLEHWSLSMLNKRASAWEQQERRAASKRKKEQAAAATEAGEGEAEAAAGDGTDAAVGAGSHDAAGPSNSSQRPVSAGGVSSRYGGGSSLSYAPQVRIENGQVVVDVQSLTVRAQEQDLENFTRVDEQHKQLNSMSYMNRRSAERWTEAETNLFYRALTMFGTDFTAIAALFPSRDRVHMRTKFKKESKVNPDRVTQAMSGAALDEQELAELSAVVQAAVEANDEEGEQAQQQQQPEETQPPTAAAEAVEAEGAAVAGEGAAGGGVW